MCLQPEHASDGGRIYPSLAPPSGFISAAMHFAMMSAAEWDRELVAHLAAKRRRLRKSQVVGIGRTTAADQTWLFGN
jgi:hypothetical protein